MSDPAPSPAGRSGTGRGRSGGDLVRILAVEDEADIRLVLEVALQDVAGFQLKVCRSGQEAIEAAPDFDPDLILLDVMMPEMDGPETLEALRDLPETEDTPVIFLTANVRPRDVERLEGLGAIGVISKPFDPMELAYEVREVWLADASASSRTRTK